ncbi:hypothetical protein K469DRAFT_699837 [Zopfia rhizophila CBS 207.26]|uniref:Uncharacterized protein n=1 Tax=Zopfia rhizophila CBS 207.26 TaxID=1314779 RepID=A0A6A6EFD2_9PEZI|nr:hypothetical protein K469DRAFT_699837 [Zopfia rhizophila CBS 207.26]
MSEFSAISRRPSSCGPTVFVLKGVVVERPKPSKFHPLSVAKVLDFYKREKSFEYYRSRRHNQLSRAESVPTVPFDARLVTFAHILLLMICYSTKVSYLERILRFHRGFWAGHGFDIVALDAHLAEENAVW